MNNKFSKTHTEKSTAGWLPGRGGKGKPNSFQVNQKINLVKLDINAVLNKLLNSIRGRVSASSSSQNLILISVFRCIIMWDW